MNAHAPTTAHPHGHKYIDEWIIENPSMSNVFYKIIIIGTIILLYNNWQSMSEISFKFLIKKTLNIQKSKIHFYLHNILENK